jgi:hypothetical protein
MPKLDAHDGIVMLHHTENTRAQKCKMTGLMSRVSMEIVIK